MGEVIGTRLRRKKTPIKSPQATGDSAPSDRQVAVPISQVIQAVSTERDEIVVSSQEENPVVESGSETDDEDQCLLTPPDALPNSKESVNYEETIDPTWYVEETSSDSSDEEDYDTLPPHKSVHP